jgi:Ca2+-binding EF-hand superfamily protein
MRRLLLGSISTAFLFAAPLLAQEEGDLFAKLDANKDGFVSPEEVEGDRKTLFERLLRTADKDGDKKLSREEFAAGLKEPAQQRTPLGQGGGPGRPSGNFAPDPRQLEALFERMDANKDGKITKDEVPENRREQFSQFLERIGADSINKEQLGRFAGMLQGRPGEGRPGESRPGEGRPGDPRPGEPRPGEGRLSLLVALDADGDGELSAGEIEAASKSLLKLDRNGDGKLTRDEIGPPSGPLGMRLGENRPSDGRPGEARPEGRGGFFARFNPAAIRDADTDGDGKLSKAEIEKAELPPMFKQGFARLDANSDGFIDAEEMRGAFERFREGDRPRGPPGDRRPDGDGPGVPPRE